MLKEPILKSMLDDDWYKITMASVVFHLFPKAIVTYEFFNRGKTSFPCGFDIELRDQIQYISKLALTQDEIEWLKKINYMRPTFIEWWDGYRMNPSEVTVTQRGGELSVKIHGPWYRTIFWEVKLMAVISELYFKLTGAIMNDDWEQRIIDKAAKLSNGCSWMDFGTRRRFSLKVQDAVVDRMRGFTGFLGTSNPYLAFKYNVPQLGTYAHESIMGMSALYGVRLANKMWMKHWSEHYNGELGIALTDTFTTDVFLRDFDSYYARLCDGTRQDSGDPIAWGYKMISHYRKLGILSKNKKFVFSNDLTVDRYIKIHNEFENLSQPIAGIGTHFTNDVGNNVVPLNIVIKMTTADFGDGPKPVVKLSDVLGKNTGTPNAIRMTNEELGLI